MAAQVTQAEYREKQTSDLLALFRKFDNPTFVEIGVGSSPNLRRLKALAEAGGSYVGFDLMQVCEKHKVILAQQSIDMTRIEFRGNSRGSYVFKLVNWFKGGGTADVIFLDGHHTMYVDLPAAYISWCALRPGGFLVLDDTNWSLGTVATNMFNNFDSWKFYGQLYDFSQYEAAEMRQAHIGLIRDVFLIGVHKMIVSQDFGLDGYSVLQKPNVF